jgi:cation diffusion facilitator CzcD-associated flavoprotein CzcO
MGAKRILFSDDIYDALDRDNVEVVTTPIDRIDAAGVVTGDGQLREVDAIVYATGFDSTTFLTPWRVVGSGGRVLNDLWERDGAEAYLGITHTGFPNFFMMYGPNTNLGHNSIIVMIEAQTRYIMDCLARMKARGASRLDVRAEVQRNYNAWLQERMRDTVWTAIDKSWYKRDGKVTNNWVGRTTEYMKRTRAMNPDDYEFA